MEAYVGKNRVETPERITQTVRLSDLPSAMADGFFGSGVAFAHENEKWIPTEKSKVFSGASWIRFGGETEAVVTYSDFTLSEAQAKEKAELFVTALGYAEIYVNGVPVDDRLYAPAWTNYGGLRTAEMNYPIFDTMTARILYERFDITPLLRPGKNTLVLHIGGGWYCQHESRNEGVKPYGALTACYLIKAGGKVLLKSDEAVRYRKSFVTRANLYFGETQDARAGGCDFSVPPAPEMPGENWRYAQTRPAPEAVLSLADCPKDRVERIIHPECVYTFGDMKVYDLKENVAGVPVLRFRGKASCGDVCTVRFAEERNPDGSLNFHYTGGSYRMQRDVFIAGEDEQLFFPRFTWHAGRYFDVTGEAEPVEFRVIHTELTQTAFFHSSDPTLQWIFDTFVRTQLNNVHGSIPSDCPHRERLGYTGDGQLCAGAVMRIFDARAFYRKWMRDIADCQDIRNGHVQHTAPFYGGGGGPGGWGSAIVTVPYQFYRIYGERDVLQTYYPNMLLYLEYLRTHSEGELVVREEEGGWCLGDWCSPGNRNLIPVPFVNTYFRLKSLSRVAEIGKILGRETADLEEEYERVKEAFLQAFYDEETGTFCESREAADAYGYDLGLGDARTRRAIKQKYAALGQFDTGIFGTDILIRVLCENGETALAKTLLTSTKENSFYNMKRQGATTLWENWDGCDSRDHPMFGAVAEALLTYFNEA